MGMFPISGLETGKLDGDPHTALPEENLLVAAKDHVGWQKDNNSKYAARALRK